MDVQAKPCYKRILLKLSGEALMGEDSFGINRAVLQHMIEELRTALDLGVQVGIVVGGGNIFRGVALGATGMDRATGDYMGMLATVMNAMALQDCCRNNGIEARVQSALNIEQVAEPYIRGKALRHLRLGRVVIFAAGTGNPFMTTDTTAALRGAEVGADIVLKATKVDGIYTADPKKDPTATMYDEITFDEALRTLAAVNGLLAERDAQDVWTLWREEPAAQGGKASAGPAYMRRRQFTPNELRVDSLGRITARIARGNVQDVILDLCDELELNYYFQSPVNLTAGVWVDGTDFETLLSVLLKGSPYSYYTERGIWIFGAAASDGLSSATVLPLVYRSVSKVEEIIPEALKQNVAVKTFPDLNALILSGDRRDVARVETFLRSVDKPVPMVTMEILIADVTKSKIHEIGVGAGVGDKALEEDGVVRLLSTPKLSTLNGHEATLTSGETQYYKEVQNNYYGTQNPISSESYQWKSVDANLSIKVTPYVSEDRQITLEIEFEQTEFTDRAAEDAPPGTATRSFKSIVKVQNEEMVLLGGLDRNTMERSSRGVPFLARVPVIKWFFGKEKRNKVERTLNIFIKPTVVE